jgi:hypothetical protein
LIDAAGRRGDGECIRTRSAANACGAWGDAHQFRATNTDHQIARTGLGNAGIQPAHHQARPINPARRRG